MIAERLTKDLVATPQMWRMAAEIGEEAIEVVIYSTHEDNSLIYSRQVYSSAASSPLAAIEDIVYENPLLLSDFSQVDILVDCPRFTVVPDVLDDDVREQITAAFWPGDGIDMLSDSITGCFDAILTAIDRPLASFLRRTFPDARVRHRLVPLATFFANKSRLGSAGKMYVHFHGAGGHRMDILAFGRGCLKMANTFAVTCADDALYYILSAARTAGFSLQNDEMLLCGDAAMREELMTQLRIYVSCVMPVIFPSAMFRAGKDALRAPFSLVLIEATD